MYEPNQNESNFSFVSTSPSMAPSNEENYILTNVSHCNYDHGTFTDNLTFNHNGQHPYHQKHIPKEYVKTFYYVITLFVVGILLIIFSFIQTKTSKKCPFILGIITILPGSYFTFQFCRYKFARIGCFARFYIRDLCSVGISLICKEVQFFSVIGIERVGYSVVFHKGVIIVHSKR